MRRTVVASVSLLPELATDLSRVAKELGKARSEVFREALEAYLRLYRLRKLQGKLERSGAPRGARSEEDVERLVHEYRRRRRT